jgi:hypothetical protein
LIFELIWLVWFGNGNCVEFSNAVYRTFTGSRRMVTTHPRFGSWVSSSKGWRRCSMTRWSRSKVMAICWRVRNDADERISPFPQEDAIYSYMRKMYPLPSSFILCILSSHSEPRVTECQHLHSTEPHEIM